MAYIPIAKYYLVSISMCERSVILARAIGGPVFVHGGGGRGFVHQAALCRRVEEKKEKGCKINREIQPVHS